MTDSDLRISTASTAATSTASTAATAVQNEGIAISLGDDNLRADRDIVTAAITRNGSALECPTANQTDYEMVMRAVQSNGYALQHASSMPQCLCKNVDKHVDNSDCARPYTSVCRNDTNLPYMRTACAQLYTSVCTTLYKIAENAT